MKLAFPLAAAFLFSAALPAFAWHEFFDDAIRARHSDFRTRYTYRHYPYRHHHYHGRCVGLAYRSCGSW